MKKITLLLLFTLLFTSLSYGQYLNEGFEGGTTLPAGWVLTQVNANETWEIGTTASAANTGTNYATIAYDAALGAQNETITTPIIDLTSATNPRLVFSFNMSYFWAVSPNDNYTFTVSVDDGSTVTQIFTETDLADFDSTDDNFVWFEVPINLSTYVGQNDIKILFNYSGTDGASLSVDDVKVEETPTCFPPTAITATPSSTTDVDVTWTAGGSETDWTYEYGTTGFTQGSGTTGMATTASVSLSSLTPGQGYDIYIQSNCGGSDGDSVWSQAVSWTQPVPPPANDLPANAISLTVEADLACVNGITGISNDGTTDSGVTAPSCGSYNTTNGRGDLWYTVVAPAGGAITFDVNNVTGLTSVAGAFYSGTVGSLVEESCTEFSSGWPWTVTGLTAGNTYYVRVWDYGNDQTGTFDLCAGTPPPPPSNDDCANATAINSLPFNSVGDATSATNNGGFLAPTGCGSMNDGVWYSFTTVDAGTVDIALSGNTGWDAEIAIYTGSCGTFTCVANADSGGSGGGETLTGIAVDANTQYWINIAYWSGSTDGSEGPYTIDVSTSDTTTTLSVDDSKIEGFTLFPTIVKGELNFTSQNNVEQISVFNLLGQQVFSEKLNVANSYVDLSTLRGGVYIVKVKVGDKVGTYKIIKE